MLYQLNEFRKTVLFPANVWSETANAVLTAAPHMGLPQENMFSATVELLNRSTRTFAKPSFGIEVVQRGDVCLFVKEAVLMEKSYCELRHFKRLSESDTPFQHNDPKVLIVAPLSGHYATLLRDTARAMIPFHDVYITDWKNARDISRREGGFNFEKYIDYLLDFLRFLGPNVHIIAVCQPSVPVMCAVSLLSEYDEPCQPKTMTLMGGPIDTRINPGPVNKFTQTHNLEWFKRHVISPIPLGYEGAGRKVCPGFMLLTGFMSLNVKRHQNAVLSMYDHLVKGDDESAQAHRRFYDEYRAVMDLDADYYLESLRIAFYDHELPRGQLKWRGYKINPHKIRKTALLTVEGELDDISCPGQTLAAHDLCSGLSSKQKFQHFQDGVGHYGIFNGRRWRQLIQPVIHEFIRAMS